MKIFFMIIILAAVSYKIQTLNSIAVKSEKLQNRCLNWFSDDAERVAELKAFLCGKDLPENQLKQQWIQTGLYHLLVVSGTHLLFILWIIHFLEIYFPTKNILPILLTITLTLATGFQPPIVRALIGFIINIINSKCRMNYHPYQVVTASGIITVTLFPDWIQSKSLLLSWLASLALTQGQSPLQKSFYVYLFNLPCLWGWGQINPLTIMTNLFIAPVVSVFLSIASLVYFFNNPLLDLLLNLIHSLLANTCDYTIMIKTAPQLNLIFIWSFVIIITIYIHGRFVVERQNNWNH